VSGPYRTLGVIADEKPGEPDLHDVIQEAWRILKEAQVAYVGPEPGNAPPWWRFIARATWQTKYTAWQRRREQVRYQTPDKFDLICAAMNLRARPRLVGEAFDAHDRAHGKAK
jgi:hypothetical protein